MVEQELADKPIHELAPLIETGELTPVALLEACVSRIQQTDPVLHAFVLLCADRAYEEAKVATQEIASGNYRGKLHGIPFAVKDLFDVAGLPTGAGSLHLRNNVMQQTATVVRRLTNAGAIFLGKTHMVEFAFGGWGTNTHLGAPRNPWDMAAHRSPGGSSSGSGVAVAAGMIPFSLASDTGGSIRSPASMNGIVGLKPTISSVSTHGVFPLSQTLDSIGPLTRSVQDAELVYNAISGIDILDPGTWCGTACPVEDGVEFNISRMRLGLVTPDQLPGVPPDIRKALAQSACVFRESGAEVVELRLPRAPVEYCIGASHIIRTEGYANLAHLMAQDRGEFDPFVRERIFAGNTGTAAEFAARMIERRKDMVAIQAALKGFDALLLPSTPIASPPLAAINEYEMPLSDLTRFVNYLGMCALALPNGVNPEGMPLSLQIVAMPMREDIVLKLGRAFERATKWHARRPDLSSLHS